MDIKDFKAGVHREGPGYRYFLPERINHPFGWSDPSLSRLLEQASLKLGELNSFSRLVPDTDQFIRMHILKEALESSRIEGTRTNMEEALAGESDIDPERRDDWLEVHNYVEAMNAAIEALGKLPLSNRLLRDTHRILLGRGRGEHKTPGEFRRSQNWIGGSTPADAHFVPPAHPELPELLGDFEAFLNNEALEIPHLVRIAIAHYQFETIHPFLDGNGRIGRLLITLYLVAAGILGKPLLYLSVFFEKNRSRYYEALTLVRTRNDLAGWLRFFLTGIGETAAAAVLTLEKIILLKTAIEKERILGMGKRAESALALLQGLFRKPLATVGDVEAITGLSPKAAGELVQVFVERGILEETTGGRRNRVFLFREYMRLFS